VNTADHQLTETIVDFVKAIGIDVTRGVVDTGSFLPGVAVVDGGLIIDESKLNWPGDILHEAGHLAVTPAAHRSGMSGTVDAADGHPDVVEVEAICWSYAACLHLRLDPRVVFHDHGYDGRSEALLRNFEVGVFLGVRGLEMAGMTLSRVSAAETGGESFPSMVKWVRD
jgi:hypothetical protein